MLIVGANDAGEALLRSLHQHRHEQSYKPVGFVDDRPEVLGRRIAGVPVLGSCSDLATLASKHQIEEVLITAGLLPGKQVRLLTEQAREHTTFASKSSLVTSNFCKTALMCSLVESPLLISYDVPR